MISTQSVVIVSYSVTKIYVLQQVYLAAYKVVKVSRLIHQS